VRAFRLPSVIGEWSAATVPRKLDARPVENFEREELSGTHQNAQSPSYGSRMPQRMDGLGSAKRSDPMATAVFGWSTEQLRFEFEVRSKPEAFAGQSPLKITKAKRQ
jgi:hypothetical protein